MLRLTPLRTRILLTVALACGSAASACAQKHSLGSAPPTVPPITPPHPAAPPATTNHLATPTAAPIVRQPPTLVVRAPAVASAPPGPVAAISTGLGALQFAGVSVEAPAPQSLTRQLASDDERTRIAALTSIGAPGQYLERGHASPPHSLQLDFLQLGSSDELDAVLTVELDQHVVSAIMAPEGSNWRRIATLTFASSFSAGTTTPSNFVHPLRSWLEPGRYRAVYHATVSGPTGDFTENEADLRVIKGRAEVVISFVSGARQCDTTGQLRPPHQTCEILQRWFEPDPADPTHHFTLITGTGHLTLHEAADPLSHSREYRLSRLRTFACQPFTYSEGTQQFEPAANSAPCAVRDTPTQHPDHTSSLEHPVTPAAPTAPPATHPHEP